MWHVTHALSSKVIKQHYLPFLLNTYAPQAFLQPWVPLLMVQLPLPSSGADVVSWTHQEMMDTSVCVPDLWNIEGMIPLMVNISRCHIMCTSSCGSDLRDHLLHLLAPSKFLHNPRLSLSALGPSSTGAPILHHNKMPTWCLLKSSEVVHTLPKKKKMAGMKHVASFPSTYHETHDMVLTWDDPQGKWPANMA